jgi:hypothetical protein
MRVLPILIIVSLERRHMQDAKHTFEGAKVCLLELMTDLLGRDAVAKIQRSAERSARFDLAR